jgi:3-oxoacyl-[acyl-carrier-protein] synthase III
LSPCLAAEVHAYLGLPEHVIAFDVNHACDGWVFGINLANKLGGRTMLICVDRLRYAPNPIEGLIFSDAVAITMVQAGFDSFKSYTDGSKAPHLYCGLDGEMTMDGDVVFDFVTSRMPIFIKSFGDRDFLVPHQANLSMNRILEARSGYGGRTVYSIKEYGNQSMCSVPTCIAHNEDKLMNKNILAVGFGAGFTAAGIGLYWQPLFPSRIVEV